MKKSISVTTLVPKIYDSLAGIFGAVRGPLVEISLSEAAYPYEVCVKFVGDKSAMDAKNLKELDQHRALYDGELFISATHRDAKQEESPPGSELTGVLIHYHFRTKELK